MLAESLLNRDFYAQAMSQSNMIIAGVTDVPVQITHDFRINCRDISSSHVEADVIIAQLAAAMSLDDKSVRVVCDDTDVSVLLVHFYNRMCINQAPMILASPVRDRVVTDIRSTAALHKALLVTFMDYLVLDPLQHYMG